MNHDHAQPNQKLHLWLMLACCLIPIGLIFAIGMFGISLGPLSPFLPYAIVLLCPLLMFFMMRGMGREHSEAETHHGAAAPAAPAQAIVGSSQGANLRPNAALNTDSAAHQHHH